MSAAKDSVETSSSVGGEEGEGEFVVPRERAGGARFSLIDREARGAGGLLRGSAEAGEGARVLSPAVGRSGRTAVVASGCVSLGLREKRWSGE